MIDKAELRIGNRVLYKPYGNKDGEPITIQGMLGMKAFFDRHSNESGMFFNLQPIPITREWFERLGFEPYAEGVAFIYRYKPMYTYEPGDRSRIEIWNLAEPPEPEKWVFDKHRTLITAVHQVQNLIFALTGKDPEIKP